MGSFRNPVTSSSLEEVLQERRRQRRERVLPFNEVREPVSLADRIARVGHALTAAELSEFLNIGVPTIYEYAREGRIPSFRIGTLVRFDPAAVSKWLRTQ